VNWIEPEEMLKRFGVSQLLILRDEAIYGALSPEQRAASDFHEAAYRVRRAFGLSDESGSNFVRMFTAQAFASGAIDADLFARIAAFERVESNGDRVFFTARPCSERAKFLVTNLGKGPVKTFGTNLNGQFYVVTRIPSGENHTMGEPWAWWHAPQGEPRRVLGSLHLSLERGGTLGNFSRPRSESIQVEIRVCGEVFTDRLMVSKDGAAVRTYWVQSAPL
jgi:hypothetical protein